MVFINIIKLPLLLNLLLYLHFAYDLVYEILYGSLLDIQNYFFFIIVINQYHWYSLNSSCIYIIKYNGETQFRLQRKKILKTQVETNNLSGQFLNGNLHQFA